MHQQQDKRWASIPLGTGGGETIGSAGCLLTCGSDMLLAEHGNGNNMLWFPSEPYLCDPGTLNRWLCRNNGYASGNLVVFAKLGEPAGLVCEVIDCSRRAAPMDKVRATLGAGGYPLVTIDYRPGGSVQRHWVRILELTDDDALIHDPWLPDGGPYWLMARYSHWTWGDVARAVFRMALYTKAQPIRIHTGPYGTTIEDYKPGGTFVSLGPRQISLSPRDRSLRARLVARGRGARRRMGR